MMINSSISVKSELIVALNSWAFLIKTVHCISFICTGSAFVIDHTIFFPFFHLRFHFFCSGSLKSILDFNGIVSFYMKTICKKHKLFYAVQKVLTLQRYIIVVLFKTLQNTKM